MRKRGDGGFTLVEALLSTVILALMASVITAVYVAGVQALQVQGERALLDSAMRSRMELLLSEKFSQLANGSVIVTVDGTDYTLDWTVVNTDLDGDATPEATAKLITVTLDGNSLSTIFVDHVGRVGKL